MYEFSDRAVRDMNRRNIRLFGTLKQLLFDELYILTAVSKVYDESVKIAKKRYRQIANAAYVDALVATGKSEKAAQAEANDTITDDWVLDFLEDYDAITLYRFIPEAERKKQRIVEALIASHKRNDEVDKALKLWSLQISQYAIKMVDEATMGAYKSAGVQYVVWNTQDDERVCTICSPRDGKIYRIDEAPPKAHYGCRCYYLPAKRGKR